MDKGGNVMNEFSVVGRRLPGIDAAQKATGRARYADDYTLSGMAFARIMRSPHPHARILNIDTRRAKRLPGVLAVVTAADVPDERQGLGLKDQPIFARDKVRYIGETMAGVVAIDEETAWEGMNLIDVQYEPLPAVFDPEEALEPGAPIIHEDLTSYEVSYHRTDESMRGNVAYHGRIHQGQPAEGFKASDFLFEDTFRTQKVHPYEQDPGYTLGGWRGFRRQEPDID
jgi:CO/xanthine dehydrogenase Mo-binding subunit